MGLVLRVGCSVHLIFSRLNTKIEHLVIRTIESSLLLLFISRWKGDQKNASLQGKIIHDCTLQLKGRKLINSTSCVREGSHSRYIYGGSWKIVVSCESYPIWLQGFTGNVNGHMRQPIREISFNSAVKNSIRTFSTVEVEGWVAVLRGTTARDHWKGSVDCSVVHVRMCVWMSRALIPNGPLATPKVV